MMKSFSKYLKECLKDPEFRKAYDDLELEFALIGKIIEKKNKGMTTAQLAKKMGVSQAAVNRFERGESDPTWKFLQKLADALGVKLKITLSH
ncbi:MAG: helix-turn-helix transcriptional regulator [Parcubacteria group bacterium]|nr:helix-turn-helix transcriptional regulator [Parcubacteria group bacterium]